MFYRQNFNLSVYFIADPSLCAGRDVTDVVRQAAQGGVSMVQLRNKSANVRDFVAQACACKEVLQPFNIPLIVNDNVDVALVTGADGVHLGQGDMTAAKARKLLGPGKIIGLTAFEKSHIRAINPRIVDYIGTGPVYVTKTDKGKPVLGVSEFARLVDISRVPVVGIGGITPENAAPVIKAGASGVAMMRAVSQSDNPVSSAQSFVKVVAGAKAARVIMKEAL